MKKVFFALFLGLALMSSTVMAQKVTTMHSSYTAASFAFETKAASVGSTSVNGNNYTTLSFPTSSPSNILGRPNLPVVTEIIEVPLCENIQVVLTDVQTKKLNNLKYPLMPVQPAPSKSDTAPKAFVFDNEFYADSVCHYSVVVRPMGIARDRKVATLTIQPFDYNPATGELSQIVSATITLRYSGTNVQETEKLHTRYYSPDFALGHKVLGTLPASKDVSTSVPIHYLIVAHSSFRGHFDNFVNWKKRQGFLVTVAYTDDNGVGTSNTSIANYIKSFYTNATPELPAPTYLLLIGDHQQIPAFNARCSHPSSSHVTDLYFSTWTDGDHLPDCYYGRFSARTVGELTPQIEKTLYYEGYNFEDDSYLGKGILISGVDGGYVNDNAYRYADPAMDYIAKYYVNQYCGFNDVRYYKNNTSFAPAGVTVTGSSQSSSSEVALRNLYSQGYGWINYSAHGDDNKWHEPELTTNQVANMNNVNKPSVMIGNCCLSGRFNTPSYDACLGEALLRRNNNAGAVVYFGGTNSTYWPHDFCWSVGVRNNISNTMDATYNASYPGMYDLLFHTHGEDHTAWHNTAGAMVTAGNNTIETYGSYQLYYWEIYELFGDPSLMPWLGKAAIMDYTADQTIPLGTASYCVSVAPYSYVALTQGEEHDLIAAAYADANGNAMLEFATPLTIGEYELVIWAQNYQPVFTPVNVIELNGPYVSITSIHPASQAKPNEVTSFDITLTNIGVQDIASGSIYLTAQHDATVINPNAYFSNLNRGDTITITNVCPTLFHQNLVDGSIVKMTAQAYFGGAEPSTRNTTVNIHSSNITASLASVNPILNNRTTSTITVNISNSGTIATSDLTVNLTNNFGFVANQASPVTLPSLASGSTATASFTLTMGENVPETALPFELQITDDQGNLQIIPLSIRCGASYCEDFETGDFSAYQWQQGLNPWIITSSSACSGTYSARSKSNLGNNDYSILSIVWNSSIDDSISFDYKVSSEANYDIFRFTIDGEDRVETSGQVDWTHASFAIPAGQHTFEFSYAKDYSTASGSDCAWIDNVSFPFAGVVCQYTTDTVCQNAEYSFNGQSIATDQTGTFVHWAAIDNVNNYLSLAVMPEPQVSIEVSEYNGCMLLKAVGATRYVWNTGEESPYLVACPSEPTTYSVTGYRGGCSGEASTTLLSINEANINSTVNIYPNPAHDYITIDADGIRSIQLINLMGQTIMRKQVCGSNVNLSLNNIPNGVYFVRVETANNTIVRKLVRK